LLKKSIVFTGLGVDPCAGGDKYDLLLLAMLSPSTDLPTPTDTPYNCFGIRPKDVFNHADALARAIVNDGSKKNVNEERWLREL